MGKEDLIKKITEQASRINTLAKKLLQKQSLSPNIDLVSQCQNQIKYFDLLNQLKKVCVRNGLKMMMLTLIVHHTKSDSLNKSYRILNTASKKLFHNMEWQKFKNLIGVRHFVKRLEVDYSDAEGWHPHYHLLLICENSIVVENLEEYEKKFSKNYFKFCCSVGMSDTAKIKDYMQEHGLNLISNFQNPAYLSDCRKLLKNRIAKLSEKYFSPYLMNSYQGYERQYKEFAKFLKGKKIFEFSHSVIEGVIFNLKFKQTKLIKPVTTPDLNNLQTSRYYKVEVGKKWHIIYQFLPDRMLKHYGYLTSDYFRNKDYRKFKIWLCYISGVDWFNFYRYVKENIDTNIFSVKRKAKTVPLIVLQLVGAYEEFLSNIYTADYKDEFTFKSHSELIEDYEHRKEFLDFSKLRFENGKFQQVG